MRARRLAHVAVVAAVPIVLLAGYSAYSALQGGVDVTVNNQGNEALQAVTVHVTGRSYDLGDIEPGAVKTARVNPTSESHVELEFTMAAGQRVRGKADSYFEAGYRGTIRIEVQGDKIVRIEDRISLPNILY